MSPLTIDNRKKRKAQWYKENRERLLALAKARREANPEKYRVMHRLARYKRIKAVEPSEPKKPGPSKKHEKSYYQRNKEKVKAAVKAWQAKNPERTKALNAKARKIYEDRKNMEWLEQRRKVA